MKTAVWISGLLAVFGFSACNNVGVENKTADSTIHDTSPRLDTIRPGSSITVENVTGYYTGVLPCSDCDGIRQQLLLSPDMNFHIEENFIGKNIAPYLASGRWETSSDSSIQLLVRDSIIAVYASTDSGLVHLGQSGAPMTKALAGAYLLRKQTIGNSNSAWMKKKNQGVDFIGIGTEPFWSLEITNDKSIVFLLADNNKPVTFPYKAPVKERTKDVFAVVNGKDKLSLSVVRAYCSDGMSDTWYEYKVELDFNGIKYRGCGVNLGF